MMSLISNYVFKEILQSLLVYLLFLVIHRCLTLCVCVCMCDKRHAILQVRVIALLHSKDSGRNVPGLPNYYSPNSSCLVTVVIASPVV